MMKQNKIATQFLLKSHAKMIAFWLLCAGACMVCGEFGNYHSPEVKTVYKFSEVIIIAGVALILLHSLASDITRANKISEHIMRDYLKEIFVKNPDLKIFEGVLYNKKALHSITTYLMNTLTKSETKEVLDILHQMDGNIVYTKPKVTKGITAQEFEIAKQRQFKFDRLNHVKKCHARILQVIREHASIHPEFINEIRYAICTDITFDNQYVR